MLGYFFGMSLLWWVFWIALIALCFSLLAPVPRMHTGRGRALEILARRYAAGEIDSAEYDLRRARLLADAGGEAAPGDAYVTTVRREGHPESTNSTLRGFNMVMGAWLFFSAFLWNHSPAQRVNTWIVGAICFVIAYIAFEAAKARYVNAVVAVWLAISAFALPHASAGTIWNNAIVALAVFVAAMVPVGGGMTLVRRAES